MRNSTHTVLGQSRAERDASLAEKDKSLAQMNKSRDGLRATKRYQPEGDLGEAKNKHLLPPPQSEELMELKLDDATEFVAALTGERHD